MVNYPYTIRFTGNVNWIGFLDSLHWIPAHKIKNAYSQPPKEYKSSSYRVWYDYYTHQSEWDRDEIAEFC